MGVHFPLKVEKAVQALSVLFRADSVARMNYMRALKLLYIADREALGETGRPITGGPVVAMERGPVLEEVYHLIRGQHRHMPVWDKYFQKNRYDLLRIEDPDIGQLSRYEIRKLQEVAKRHCEDDEWDLVRVTHGFEEWKTNDPGNSSRPISLEATMKAVGRGEDAAEIIADACEKTQMDRLFGR